VAYNSTNLQHFLTSIEPGIEQLFFDQSIGGYLSTSLLFEKATLGFSIGKYDNEIIVTDYENILGQTYISIDGEIIETQAIASPIITVVRRGVFGGSKSHYAGSIIRSIDNNSFFDTLIGRDYLQYRCVALKNTDSLTSYSNVSVDIIENSDNQGSLIELAVEVPVNDAFLQNSADGGSKMTVIDSSFIGYTDNIFNNSVLSFPTDPYSPSGNMGQYRLISSFDGSTGTFVLNSSLPLAVSAGDIFDIEPSPASRLSTCFDNFNFNSNYISGFVEYGSIDVNFSGLRMHGSNLNPGDTIYIWLKKKYLGNSAEYLGNGFCWDISYS